MTIKLRRPKVIALTLFTLLVAQLLVMTTGLARAGVNGWTTQGPWGGSVSALAIDPQNPATVYAGTGRGAYKSIDVGSSWARSGLVEKRVLSLAINPIVPSTLYAGLEYGGVMKSTDAGSSWAPTGLTSGSVFVTIIDPQVPTNLYAVEGCCDAGSVYKSTDGGLNWTPSGANGVTALAIDFQEPSTLYAGTYRDGVLKTTDGGASWTPINVGVPVWQVDLWNRVSYREVLSLAIDPVATTTLYVSTDESTDERLGEFPGGVFKTTDGGSSWNPADDGLPDSEVNDLEVDPKTPSTIYAANSLGVYRTSDGGSSWQAASSGIGETGVGTLVIDPIAPATVYVGVGYGPGYVSVGYRPGLFKTTNGGSSWGVANSGISNTHVKLVAVDPKTPSTVYAVADEGLLKSIDGGQNWAVTSGPTWIASFAIDPMIPTTLYASPFFQGLMKSVDGGATWNSLPGNLGSVRAIAFHPNTPSTLYAGEVGVWKSSDAGVSWASISNGLPDSEISTLAIDPVNPTTMYAGLRGGWGIGIYKTINGGASWTPIFNSGLENYVSIYGLAIDPKTTSTIYASGYSGGSFLLKSTNGGASWIRTDTDLGIPVIDPKNSSIQYATNGGGVFKSANGGSSWTAMNDGLIDPNVWALAIDPVTGSTLYAGTYGGGVFDLQTAPPPPPNTAITSGPSGTTNSTSATFAFTSTAAGATFQCRIDGGAYSSCAPPKSYSGLSSGPHAFEVRATDSWGQTDATPASRTWTVDTQPPETTIVSGPSETTNSTGASFQFTSSESGSSFQCGLDGAASSACTSPKSYSGLSNGSHTFQVKASDPAGNTDLTPASRTWTVDTNAPPVPTLLSPADGSTADNSKPTFDWSDVADPSGVKYQVQVDNSGTSFPSPEINKGGLTQSNFTSTSQLAKATYYWRVRATDGAGNVGPWSSVFNVRRQ